MQVAHDAIHSLQMLENSQFELAFLDLGLPRMSGYELARRIRSLKSAKRMQLIALTGWGQDEDRRKSQEAGFDLHLTKPYDPLQLMASISGPGGGAK